MDRPALLPQGHENAIADRRAVQDTDDVSGVGGADGGSGRVGERTRRVSKALRVLKGEGLVHGARDARGNMVWQRKSLELANRAQACLYAA
jgi:hypothetical protein